MTITFYDIPSSLPGIGWSPNTFKARIALNYKGIPYKTEWVEYPDIEGKLKELGGTPTSKKPDGRGHYTLPAIYDSSTGKVITDSMNIAIYLEDTYPDTPSLFPKGTRAATELLNFHFLNTVASKLLPLMLPPTCLLLNPRSAEYFRTTREKVFGKKLEEITPPGPIREAAWAEVKEGLEKLAKLYEKNGKEQPYFFGETFSYADAIVAGFLVWVRIIWGPESAEWKTLASWNEGRWAKLLELREKDLVIL